MGKLEHNHLKRIHFCYVRRTQFDWTHHIAKLFQSIYVSSLHHINSYQLSLSFVLSTQKSRSLNL
jgi:hypothetical protein